MKRKKLLLVEDEIIIAMSEANLLMQNGYDVIIATSGKKAIEKIGNTPDISLILMDIDLGKGIDGTETAKIILDYKEIPIVFLTSHTEKEIVSKVKEITRYGYILKGSNDFVFLSSIEMAYELFDSHQKTKESERRFKNLFHKHNAIMLLINPESGDIIDANLSAEKFYGHTLDTLRTMTIFNINNLDKESINSEIEKAKKEERNYFIFPHKLSNGEIRIVEVHSSPIDIDNENLLFSIIHDITDREKVEKSLKESEKLYRLLAENSNDVIWTLNLNREFTYVSPSVFQLRGYTPDEVKKQKMEDVICDSSLQMIQEAFINMLSNYEKNIMNEKSEYFEVEQPCKNGSTIWTEATARLVKNEDGELIVVGNSRDISQRKSAEEKIKTLLLEKELLLKEVHHRIKNNMTTIVSLLSLQSTKIKDPEAINALLESRNRIKTMSDIYDKLYKTTDYNNLNIKDYLTSIIEYISNSYKITEKILITKHIEDFNINSKIAFPLGVIITELITNSLKYAFPVDLSSSGIINITISLVDRKVILLVSDNGIGISKNIIDNRLFGFGLNLVEILTEQLSGSFEITNTSGSLFKITFPLV